MSSKKHQDRHCRVCCKALERDQYKCCQYTLLLHSLGIDQSTDNEEVHPGSFCHSCYVSAKTLVSSGKNRPTSEVVQWSPHSEENCNVCDIRCKGGRPKKKRSSAGRPSFISLHIKSVALNVPSFCLTQVSDEYKEEVTCRYCHSAINNPVEILPCKSLLCCSCSLSLSTSSSFACPGCSNLHDSTETTFTKPSTIIEKMINSLYVKCDSCQIDVKLQSLTDDCETHKESNIIAAGKLVSQMIRGSSSQSSSITVPTGGRVSILN